MSVAHISIVVLQWNNLELTQRCVASLRTNSLRDHEIIIVDNGSDEDAVSWAQAAADRSVLLDRNLGFARGMNAGLAVAESDVVMFVNNDTTFPTNWDEHLTDTLGEGSAGIVAPAVTSGGNASSVRSEPGGSTRLARRFVDLPSGVVYVMSTPYVRSLGGWSEDYEMASSEDLDLLFAIWVTGKEVVIDDRVLVDHLGSATVSTQLPDKGRLWRQNRKQFVDLWHEMDESRFRQRYNWAGQVSGQRLSEARIAAYWMSRFFAESDEHAHTATQRHPSQLPGPTARSTLWDRWTKSN